MSSNYRNLKAWQKAIDLVDAVYTTAESLPKSEWFALGKQMRSAATSIPSNIAEGKGRRTDRDYRHFVFQARGSAFELETQIIIAQGRRFITDEACEALLRMTAEVLRLINGLVEYLDKKIGDF